MKVPEGGFALLTIPRRVLMAAALVAATAHPRAANTQQLQGQSSIVVAFVTDTAGRPLQGAEVQVVGTSLHGNTDEAGRVALVAVPVGNVLLRVRHLGFAELIMPLAVVSGVLADARFQLKSVAADLKKVVVRANELKPERYARTGRFDDFYRRRAGGMGTFLTREDVDARQAQRPEDLLRMVTGVRIRYRGNTPYIQFLRCEQVNVYIDGIKSHDAFRDYFALSPLDIEAMEVYHGMATVPPEFSPNPSDCAAVVIWTRWHGPDK